LLCRKHLRGAHLTSVEQPPWERIMQLRLQADDASATRSLVLIVEAMGRLGNVILVDEGGAIVESIKRVPPTINRVRTVLPRRPYVGPPPQRKPAPDALDGEAWAAILAGSDGAAAGAVVGAVRGLSPLAAREAVYRAAGAAGAPARGVDTNKLAAAIGELTAPLAAVHTIGFAPLAQGAARPGEKSPSVWRPSNAGTSFAPYELTHLPGWERAVTISQAIVRAGGAAVAATSTSQRQEPLRTEIGSARAREARRIESLEREVAQAGAASVLREAGELLLAYAAQLAPGLAAVELDGRSIALDPARTAIENAQAYFERYTRARDAGRLLPEMIDAGRARLAYLDEALVHVALADTPDDVAAVRAELVDAGYLGGVSQPPAAVPPRDTRTRRRSPAAAFRGPLRLRIGEHVAFLGRSARQNDQATFELGRPNDLWLHARGVAGAHLILQVASRAPDQATIQRAAAIAAHHSEARGSASVAVDVTERRHVRKIKGGAPGAVTYTGERTINVAPSPYSARVAP
jgi:predicted ribosome quality control (RQC) complex YloA/Tae2 family protein